MLVSKLEKLKIPQLYDGSNIATVMHGTNNLVRRCLTSPRLKRMDSSTEDAADMGVRKRVRSSVLHTEGSQLRWFGHLFKQPPGHLPRKMLLQPGEGLDSDLGPTGEIRFLC